MLNTILMKLNNELIGMDQIKLIGMGNNNNRYYFKLEKKLETVLVPTEKNCSILIKKALEGNLSLVSDLRKKLEYKKIRKKKGGKVRKKIRKKRQKKS